VAQAEHDAYLYKEAGVVIDLFYILTIYLHIYTFSWKY